MRNGLPDERVGVRHWALILWAALHPRQSICATPLFVTRNSGLPVRLSCTLVRRTLQRCAHVRRKRRGHGQPWPLRGYGRLGIRKRLGHHPFLEPSSLNSVDDPPRYLQLVLCSLLRHLEVKIRSGTLPPRRKSPRPPSRCSGSRLRGNNSYCFSYTATLFTSWPSGLLPLNVDVRVFPSFEITDVTVTVACPSFLFVTSTVFASIRFRETVSP